MEQNNKNIDQLIKSFLDDTMDAETKTAFVQRLSHVQKIDQAKSKAWQSVQQQTTRGQHRLSLFRITVRVAAVMLPFVLLGLLWSVVGHGYDMQHFATNTDVDSLLLPDNSTVILNTNSSVDYYFTDNQRRVIVSGMAHFRVTHDAERPFVVDAADSKVTVLGTEFFVENVPERQRVKVDVLRGRVQFSAANATAILTANQSAILADGHMTVQTTIASDGNWLDRTISLHSANLHTVVEQLLACYPQIRSVKGNAESDTTCVTTSFRSQSLDDVLDELNIHFNQKLLLDNNGILTISD